MILKKMISTALFLSMPTLCHAGSQLGTIDVIHVRASDGLIYFTLKGAAKATSPACATMGYWIIKDENSAPGKRQYALLLAAQLAGKTVAISGSNTCTRWADGEDVDDIAITA